METDTVNIVLLVEGTIIDPSRWTDDLNEDLAGRVKRSTTHSTTQPFDPSLDAPVMREHIEASEEELRQLAIDKGWGVGVARFLPAANAPLSTIVATISEICLDIGLAPFSVKIQLVTQEEGEEVEEVEEVVEELMGNFRSVMDALTPRTHQPSDNDN